MNAAIPLLLIWCSLSLTVAAAPTDRLVIGITQYPHTLHPNIDTMLAKSYVLGMVHRPITVYDRDWTLVCMLCTELPTLENGGAAIEVLAGGQQGIAVTYRLRAEARWGDGTPITTDDVLFTWEVGREPLSGVANQELYRRILSIDAHDGKTFTLHLDRVTFDYNAVNDLQLLPAHLERGIFQSNPADYRYKTKYESEPANAGLYTGPYKIVGVARGSHIELAVNPQWWGAKPAFVAVVVKAIENTAALEANVLSGEIDMIAGELGLSLDQALAFEKRHKQKFRIIYKPGLIYEHVDLNLANPILQAREVREALVLGIDRQAISSQLFENKQPVAHSNVNPLDWIHDQSVPKYRYDPKRAGELLDQAAWNIQKKGLRHNEAGDRLTLELMSTSGNRSRELVEQVLQSQWRDIGIDVRIRNEPARVFFGETVTRRKYRALAMYAWMSAPESVPRSTLHSTEIPAADNGFSGQNYTGYANPEMDRLLDAIETELDRDKRKTLWRALQHLYARDLPVIPLYFRADAYILPTWLKGVKPTGHQYPSTLWIEEWSVSP